MALSGSPSASSVCNLLTCMKIGQSVRELSYDWAQHKGDKSGTICLCYVAQDSWLIIGRVYETRAESTWGKTRRTGPGILPDTGRFSDSFQTIEVCKRQGMSTGWIVRNIKTLFWLNALLFGLVVALSILLGRCSDQGWHSRPEAEAVGGAVDHYLAKSRHNNQDEDGHHLYKESKTSLQSNTSKDMIQMSSSTPWFQNVPLRYMWLNASPCCPPSLHTFLEDVQFDNVALTSRCRSLLSRLWWCILPLAYTLALPAIM